MRPVAVRPARPFDAGAMAALLNTLPTRAGPPVAACALRDWMAAGDIWHVAERGGDICGFQWIGPRSDFSPRTWEIATFMALGEDGIDAGSALFEATRAAAKSRGLARIVARHARENASTRAYYRSRGFEEATGPASGPRLAEPPGVNQVVTFYRI